jgi:hypothetical protein
MAHGDPFVSHLNGFCFVGSNLGRPKKPSPLLAQSRKAQIVIHGTIGKSGFNRQDDVRKIQNALNHISPKEGGTQEDLLVTDGICGHLTQTAIQHFQDIQFGKGNRLSNGIIEPNAPTINQINELFLETTVDPVRLPSLNSFIGQANQAINAAIANILPAQILLNLNRNRNVGGRVFTGTPELRLLNRHFDIDHQADPSNAVEEIRQVYSLMRTAMLTRNDSLTGTPAGVGGTGIFVIDPTPREDRGGTSTAYAFPGGFHQFHQFDREVDGLRHDQIYICAAFDNAFAERKIRVIIHELAHFVGKPSRVDGIIDHGYGLAEDRDMKKLTPRQRLLNADTYANFALEAFTGHNLTRWA